MKRLKRVIIGRRSECVTGIYSIQEYLPDIINAPFSRNDRCAGRKTGKIERQSEGNKSVAWIAINTI